MIKYSLILWAGKTNVVGFMFNLVQYIDWIEMAFLNQNKWCSSAIAGYCFLAKGTG